MSKPLSVLILEDRAKDAEMIIRELRRAGFDPQWKRVQTEPDFLAELEKAPDIILSDYSMPQFDGLQAAKLLQARGLDIPFILISGTVGEETAVTAMKSGVTDYLLKDRLARLGEAVEHALHGAKKRDEHKKAEQQIRLQTRALEAAANAILITDRQGKIVSANTAFCAMTGYAVEEVLGQNPRLLKSGAHAADFYRQLWQTICAGQIWRGNMTNQRKDGTIYHEEMMITPVQAASGEVTHFIAIKQDITERKRAEEVLRKVSGQEAGRKKNRVLRDLVVIFGLAALVEAFAYFTDVLEPPFETLVLKFKGNLDDLFAPPIILVLGLLIFSYRRWRDSQGKFSEQANMQEALSLLHGELEKRIQQRTAELTRTNNALQTEITERKRTEEALQQSQNHLRIVTENAHVGLVMINHERRYTFANGAYAEILGLPSPNLVGQRIADVLAGLYEEQIRPRLDRAFTGERVAYELRKPTPAGDCFYAVKYEPMKADGPVTMVVVVITDITDQKRAQEELIWKTTFLEAQVDSALDAILVVNNRAKVILKNQRLAQLFKIPDDIARDDDDNKMLQYVTSQVKDPKQFRERVQYLYEHPDEVGRDEIELVNGTILDRYSSPVRDKAGKHYGRIWAFRDITERRKLESQFRQSQKMEGIGRLAGGVAHDFNNILAVIEMQTELLKISGGLSAEQSEYADEINATVQRAAALTRQLLLFSSREVFQPRDLDLSASITDTAKMFRRILGEDVQMHFKLAAQPMFIHADPGMMDQILLNLVVNARDAMPNGGQLVIETSGVEFDESAVGHSAEIRTGSFVCLSVSDSGCGIPPEILPKIFEPFFTTKDVGKGTGLGLATVFGIVKQHQGWISVYSELTHGTTFRIYLPRLAKAGHAKSAQPALTTLRGGNETILLVEDDPSLRVSARKALTKLGYRILEAPTGVKAMEVWKENRDEIRLLLTDLVMPDGMTGKDLAQRILQEEPKMKVIYMSGYSAEIAGKDFPLEEGVNFLTKPFQSSKLAETIRNCLDGG
ncbi:MAG TPA: PAS domain S-box protein [Candidatus Sulfotelmatobacter sp.]|nr:PAS domain S-box protein [Candidatus Sulfotelmatobacter sp.]